MTRLVADDVVSTEPERASLRALREATRTADGPMERHCLRVFVIAERSGAELGRRVDREVLLCASLLHEIGAYPIAATGDVYTADGRRFAGQLLDPFGWPEMRIRACGDAIENHHRLSEVWELGPETELVRRADLVDVSGGLVAFGLSRGWLRGLFSAVSREGLYTEIGRIVAGFIRDRPETIPDIPKGSESST
jgi:hypothetical protein